MSARIDVLAAGYSHLIESAGSGKNMLADCSSCLVRSSGQNVLFDTMGPWQKDKLLKSLTDLKIHQDDIDYVVCSHSHPDHIGNLNLFIKSKLHFVGTSVYTQDTYYLDYFEPIGSYVFGDATDVIKYKDHKLDQNMSIQPTAGHTLECISMVVENCDRLGRVALVGDLFEKESDLDDQSVWLGAGSQNPDLQRANRSRIYHEVDYIVPGHGPMFKTDKTRGSKI